MKNKKVRRMTFCAMLAAVYTVLSLALAPMAFGPFNFRLSEVLVLLPVFSPYAIVGVTLGCLLTNVAGVALGATLPPDILFGTMATFLGAICTYLLRNLRFKKLPLAASLPPVIFNTLIIGWEINLFFLPESSWGGFVASALGVGLGEIAACCILGLPLVYTLEKTGLDRIFREL